MKDSRIESSATLMSSEHTKIGSRRFAFIMDQQVGLRTQYLNWQRVVAEDATIEATFVPVEYAADAGPITRLPILPGGVRGTLRGVAEIRRGMESVASGVPLDGALWATWAAKSVLDLVGIAPAFLVMDMTPVQMEAMGALYGYSRGRARAFGGLKRRATDRLYARATHFFPWSVFVAESLRDDYGVPAEKITVVSPGVDVERYCPDPAARAADADGVVRLLFVGGDFGRKGGDLLLRYLRERRATGINDCELHVVTRDTELAEEPGLTIYRGVANNSPELIRLYQKSDVFVLPTRADCYSLVAMEAMASGLPVVISAIGGIPDIVTVGETGYLTQPDNYGALCSALNELITDPARRAQMGAAARASAVTRFDCRANIRQILAHMREAVT